MWSRKNNNSYSGTITNTLALTRPFPKSLPTEWHEEAQELLLEFLGQSAQQTRTLFLESGLYDNEIIIIAALVPKTTPAPFLAHSFFISFDLTEKTTDKHIKTALNRTRDAAAELLSKALELEDNSDETHSDMFSLDWELFEEYPLPTYYRYSREDIPLTLEANRLLQREI